MSMLPVPYQDPDEGVVVAELVDASEPDGPDLDVLIEEWLTARARSKHTRLAYLADLGSWQRWLAVNRVDLLKAKKTDVEAWHRLVAATPNSRTRRVPAKASIARMVSSISSLYEFLVDEDYLEAVPVRSSTRPKAPTRSTTVGLSAEEMVRLRMQAREAGSRERAIVDVLGVEGLRVGELADLVVDGYGWNKGKRTLVVVGKGEKRRELVVDHDVREALDVWLAELAAKLGVHELDPDTPMFPSIAGGRLSQQAVMRTIQRLAKAAGIPSWRKLSPHSLRHTCATLMLDAGVPINVVQDQLGHEDISTTLRYDRARGSLDRSGMGSYEGYLRTVEQNMTGEAA